MQQQTILVVSTIFIAIAGILSAVTGIWFIVGDHPFHREGGFSEEFGMTKVELESINQKLVSWPMHVSDQVGSVSMGWGLFIVILALLGIRKVNKMAWYALWIAGTPTLIISTFDEFIQFGTLDTGSMLSMAVFSLFIIGMILPVKIFMKTKLS